MNKKIMYQSGRIGRKKWKHHLKIQGREERFKKKTRKLEENGKIYNIGVIKTQITAVLAEVWEANFTWSAGQI